VPLKLRSIVLDLACTIASEHKPQHNKHGYAAVAAVQAGIIQ
jgi:hypothetical protein